MKSIFVFCGILFALCIFVLVEGDCEWYGEIYPVGEHILNCTRVTCNESGDWSSVGCPLYMCEETIGYEEIDLSKPYPECCGGPICKEKTPYRTST
ncbi:uncharacterized protein V1477_000468 [Vespula maculifrons]|uniref:Single domain-containing protein n=1 Tax=Vespula maculifrons TaxID=7453 RepID=A0ABD2D1N9_VESMC